MRPTVSSTSSDSPAGLQLPCSRSAPRTVVARPRAPGAPPPAARRPPSAPAPSALREGAASRPRAQGGGLRTARARFLGQLQPGKGGQLTAPLQGWGRKDPHHRPAQRQWGDRRRVVLVTGVRCVKLLKVCRIWGGGGAFVHLHRFVRPRKRQDSATPSPKYKAMGQLIPRLLEGTEGKRSTDDLRAGVPRGVPGPRPHSYSVMRLASSVQAAVELAENTR